MKDADTPATLFPLMLFSPLSASALPGRRMAWLRCAVLALLLGAAPTAQAQFAHQHTASGAAMMRSGDAPRCLTMQHEKARRAANPKLPSLEEWEAALQQKIQQAKVTGALARTDTVVYRIPTVVHVVHAGEPVGQGRNLSDAQVESEIEVMNEDFRKMMGTRGYNDDPVGADVRIEFALAKRAPSGAATDGIDRVDGTQLENGAASWSAIYGSTLDNVLKPQTIWPREQYYNIWVVEFTAGGLLGIAQFPDASGLPGMPTDGGSANTDGFAVTYQAFGSVDKEPPGENFNLLQDYQYGRTATHESGHTFGLRHIWGDGPCGADDFCADTPTAGANAHDLGVGFGPNCNTTVDCGSENMIENYMDYSDDVCMNIFTLDQRARARTVMMNSPGRLELPGSPALNPPVSNDVGLAGILRPKGFLCTLGPVSPEVELTNGGTDDLTSATITYGLESQPADQTYAWTGMLATGETEAVTLPELAIGEGDYTLEVSVSSPNGVADSVAQNNQATQSFSTEKKPLPYAQSFEEGLPDGWSRTPASGSYRWTISDDPSIVDPDGQTSTNVAFVNNFDNNNDGQEAVLSAEAVDLHYATTLMLSFDVAYARYDATYSDGLRVDVSTDCGETFTEVYNKSGVELATVSDQSNSWTPGSADAWRTETLDLTDQIGGDAIGDSTQGVQVRFVNVNGYGNNLYLDDVELNGAVIPVELANFEPTTDDGDVVLRWQTLSETGNDGFEIRHKVDGETEASFQKIGFAPSKAAGGTSTETHAYRFRVEDLSAGTHLFRLRQIDRDGTATPSDVVEATVGVSGSFELTEAYPNPTPSTTTFGVAVKRTQEVSVALYNTLGQRIRTLHEGTLEGGSTHHFTIDGGALASGLYLYRVVGEDFSGSGQVTVVR